MSKKILSFEEYVREADRSEEIEKDIVDMGEVEDLEDEVEESPEEVEIAEDEDEEEAESEEAEEEDEDEESEDEEAEEEDEDEESEDEEAEEVAKAVSEMMAEMYEAACNEAVAYENDDYEEHTVESYMKENAALAAALAAKAMESAHEQVKEEEMTVETYEAMCESMKESYAKKIDELKEAWSK